MLWPALKHRWTDRGIWGRFISTGSYVSVHLLAGWHQWQEMGDDSNTLQGRMMILKNRMMRMPVIGDVKSRAWQCRQLLLTACLTAQTSDSASSKSLLMSTRSDEKNKEIERATEALQRRTDDRLTHFEEWGMVEERKTVGLAKQISMRVRSKQ